MGFQMGLIKCQDCGAEVSTRAESCPKCGGPIGDTETKEAKVVVEATSKNLKGHIVQCIAFFFMGLFLAFFGLVVHEPKFISIGLIVTFIICPIYFIVTKIRIWWHHE
jgi:hypothetical protein